MVFYNFKITFYDLSMPKVKLTSQFVKAATCSTDARKINFLDARNPGFLLEVRRSGGKTYYQRYRDPSGRERQFKIGPSDLLSLSQALKKARQIRSEALLGSDPQKIRQQRRTIPTLAAFVRDLYLPFAMNTKRSWRTDATVLRVQIAPVLGRLPLGQITTPSIAELLSRMEKKGYAPGTVNRVLVLLRYVFNLAKRWNVPGSQVNPTAGLKPLPERCKERFLSNEELCRLLHALDVDSNRVAANAIKLLILTGARRNEVTYARWEYVNWANRTLLVPSSKTGRPRTININSAAIELLRSIRPADANPFIFPSSRTGRPSPTLHFPWTRIRKRAFLMDVRLHDLRHSFASFLVNNGVSIYVVQGLLGHTLVRTTQRYAHLSDRTLADAAEIIGTVVQSVRSEGLLQPTVSPS
jgi:integrase